MICHPPERDLIVAGATRLVVTGEHPHWCDHLPNFDECNCWGEDRIAPQRWVDATGPCPHCDGHGGLCSSRPDCDGRKREALQVGWLSPGRCGGNGYINIYDPCPGCCNCQPPVTFAYATVEVLPDGPYGRYWLVLLDNVEFV